MIEPYNETDWEWHTGNQIKAYCLEWSGLPLMWQGPLIRLQYEDLVQKLMKARNEMTA